MYSLGIDIGSVATKSVVYNGAIAASVIIPTGWSPRESSRLALQMALEQCGASRDSLRAIVATGYGRVSADFADRAITEITCHARGAHSLNHEIRTVIDIGGQDSKVIQLDEDGHVADFIMNDKCAAGTGRFLEVMARILGTEVAEFDALASHADPAPISSMCTVFAESEVISLLARGVPREAIARGVLDSIASRAVALLGRLGTRGAIAFTGGLSHSRVLRAIMEEHIGEPLFTSPASQLAGALGGALIGWNRNGSALGDN
ncbi:MAG: 2-hydroxyglutaryl-CoA dehydratase [Deltaproteobacteria bacterium]|nr:2-hydroxyglutaryl-CoA dehydratase [Deltaproteobacteria bacterium]